MIIKIVPMGLVGHLTISVLLGATVYFGLLIITKDDMVSNVMECITTKLRR